MRGNNGHLLLDVPYQGNWWWAVLGCGSLLMLSYALLRVKRKRKAGLPVDILDVVVPCVVFLGVFALALFQVLSHR